ncbi:thioredoxin reductase 1, cytoplasmic-like isoform X3 [Montipora foliosa]|uniref:thioredoxin reductase 1, cytoplasmic-like isoform X3 n=1 Tax=Montipora foliosa TaxID=591990 RepID=UPI0035F1DE6A
MHWVYFSGFFDIASVKSSVMIVYDLTTHLPPTYVVSNLKRARTPSPETPSKMAPIQDMIDQNIKDNTVMIFSKTTCPFCKKVKDLFTSLSVVYNSMELDLLGNHIGGADATMKLHQEGKLMNLIVPPTEEYTYDLIVVGGGSGGLACSKEAAKLGKKVAVLDFVKPSPVGTTWGLGGTCVNVGCIPKKLMHQAALLRHEMEDARMFGWDFDKKVEHSWATMRENVQNHIGSLNWAYRVELRDKKVLYKNATGTLVDPHTIKAVDKRGKVSEMTAQHIVLATGLRPRYPDIPGAKEYGITSDDLFSLEHSPGKTVLVGASYVALECAGFLAGVGLDVTVLVRSILLRGFDQQMAEKIGNDMQNHGVKIKRPAVPTKVELIEEGTPRKLRVFYKLLETGEESSIECNTVMFAIGRDPCTQGIGLEEVGVSLNPKNGKVIAGDNEQSSVPSIYAIGDILDGKLELTPVAIHAGKLLARRLYDGSSELCDYVNVATTVFTPLEYGSIGLSEEDAVEKYGDENIEVYHSSYIPLEYTLPKRDATECYAKLICNKLENERVVGFHVTGPNAGEVTQGYAVAIKLGATKSDFDRTVGIHPTVSEVFTTLATTKRSGADVSAGGC